MKLVKFLLYYLLGLLGIIAFSAAPTLFQGANRLDFQLYAESIWTLLKGITGWEWVYQFRDQEYNVFSFLWEPYLYSMTLIFSSLLIGFGLAFIFAVLTQFLPVKTRALIKRVLILMEAVPDLMVAFLLPMFVVFIFQKTDILLMQFATLGNDRVYLAPITVLAILPLVSLFRILLLLIEEELNSNYAEFARSKGLKYRRVVTFHVIRNILKSTFRHSKVILWGSLSSLFVIEYMFNSQGLFTLVMEDFRPMVIAAALMMVFTPFYFLYQGIEIFSEKEAFRPRGFNLSPNFGTGAYKPPLKKRLSGMGKRIAAHFRNPKFLSGFAVIFLILIVSIVYPVLQEEPVPRFDLLYDEDGTLISSKPHPPSEHVLLGTDRNGFSILGQLITGAKYTILFSAIVAFLRTFAGFILAVPYAFFVNERWKKVIERFVDCFHFLPLSLLAIILLQPVLLGTTSGFTYSFTERILVEAGILTLLVVPLTMVFIGNEIRAMTSKEFIDSARVAGGSSSHLLFRHIMPHLHSKLGIVFGQQFVQVLLVLIHLGVFNLFLGGTSVMLNESYRAYPYSVTFEWSGLVSAARNEFLGGQEWIFLPVFIGFVILIICMQFIMEGIQEVQQERAGMPAGKKYIWWKRRKNNSEKEKPNTQEPPPEKFTAARKDG